MLITEYLDKHGIEWTPIQKLLNKGGMTGDFILIDTNKYHQIDIDEPCSIMDELIDKMPYYNSVTKNLPHFFCVLDIPGCIGKFSVARIDYLKGVPAYAHRLAEVYNSELPIQNIICHKSK